MSGKFKEFLKDFFNYDGDIKKVLLIGIQQQIDAKGLNCFERDSRLLLDFFKAKELPPELKHKVFNLLFSNTENLKLFPEFVDFIEKEYSVSKEILFNGKLVEFNFPVYYDPKGKATLCNASIFIFEGNSAIDFFNTVSNKDSLNQLSEMFDKAFLISSDTVFQENSFMLSAAIALNLEFFPENFTFTGALDTSKNIIQVYFVDEKRKAAKKSKKILISHEDLKNKNFDYLLKVFSGEYPLIMPFFIDIPAKEDVNFRIFKDVENHFGKEGLIITDDFLQEKAIDKSLLVFKESSLPEEDEKDMEKWVNVANQIKSKLSEKKSQIEKMFQPNIKSLNIKTVLAIKAPVAFGYLLGLVFKNAVDIGSVAHYEKTNYSFCSVNDEISESCTLKFDCEEKTGNKLFCVGLTDGVFQQACVKFAKENKFDLCSIVKTSSGDIDVNDFLCVAEGIYKILSEKFGLQNLLILSVPVLIAFLLSYKFIPKVFARKIQVCHFSGEAGTYLSIPTDNII